MPSMTQSATAKRGPNGYIYATASQAQPQSMQRHAGSYNSNTGALMAETQNGSAQGYQADYPGNQAYYQDPQYDPTFEHVGAWAPEIPYDVYSRKTQKTQKTQNEEVSWERIRIQPPAQNAGGKKRENAALQTSYQMDRYLSQQPKQDPWSMLSRGSRN